MVSESEAMNLQADCTAARVDLEVAVSPVAQTPTGQIENFVTSDDRIFGWLENKLAAVQILRHGGRYKVKTSPTLSIFGPSHN